MRWEVDYLVIVDLEATCDETEVGQPQVTSLNSEIIEFPWLLYDLAARRVVDQQQFYVKPKWNPTLTPFCTQLTGITNERLAHAPSLEEAVQKFNDYMEEKVTSKGKSFCLMTDGTWDLQWMLCREANDKDIPLASHFRSYYDIQLEFSRALGPFHPQQSFHLRDIVTRIGVELAGQHHCGLDDCYTIARVLTRLLDNGHCLEQPIIIPEDWNPQRDFIAHWDFSSHVDPQKMQTPADLLTLFALPPEQVLRVYLFGARAWSSSPPPQELWDFVVVLSDETMEGMKEQKFRMRKMNVVAQVYSESLFQQKVKQHSFLPVCCLFLPPQHVWLDRSSSSSPPFSFALEPRRFRITAMASAWEELKHTKYRWEKGEMTGAVKSMEKGLRCLISAFEIIRYGYIPNFEQGLSASIFLFPSKKGFTTSSSSSSSSSSLAQPEGTITLSENELAQVKERLEQLVLEARNWREQQGMLPVMRNDATEKCKQESPTQEINTLSREERREQRRQQTTPKNKLTIKTQQGGSKKRAKQDPHPFGWPVFEAKYKSFYRKLETALKVIVSDEKALFMAAIDRSCSPIEQLQQALSMRDHPLAERHRKNHHVRWIEEGPELLLRVLSIRSTWSYLKPTKDEEEEEGGDVALLHLSCDHNLSPKNVPFVALCNGIVFCKDDERWRVVCYPPAYICNEGSPFAPTLDWVTTHAYPHVQGYRFTLFNISGRWHLSSSSTATAEEQIRYFTMDKQTTQECSLQSLFWQVWQQMNLRLPSPDEMVEYCYSFELLLFGGMNTTSSSKHVIQVCDSGKHIFNDRQHCHSSSSLPFSSFASVLDLPSVCHEIWNKRNDGALGTLLLISVCDLATLEEVSFENIGKQMEWPTLPSFSIMDTLNEDKTGATISNVNVDRAIQRVCSFISPLVAKGFILMDNNFNRIKIRSNQYKALCQLLQSYANKRKEGWRKWADEEDTKAVMELVRNADSSLIDSTMIENEFSVLRPFYEHVKQHYENICTKLQQLYDHYSSLAEATKNPNPKKEFVLLLKQHKVNSADAKILLGVKGGLFEDSVKLYFAFDAKAAHDKLFPLLMSSMPPFVLSKRA